MDVDSWIERKVGWHFVLFAIGALGGIGLGYAYGKKTVPADAGATFAENARLSRVVGHLFEQRDDDHALLKEARTEVGKLRSAIAACDQSVKNLDAALRKDLEK